MRVNNAKVKNIIISLYFILIVMAIVVTTLLGEFIEIEDNALVIYGSILGGFVALLFITHRLCKYFEYDSDGLKVVIMTKGIILSDYLNYREYTVEFSKPDLIKFRMYDFIFFRMLVVYLKSRHGIRRKAFNTTLVRRKKLRFVKQSLAKIIKENKQQIEAQVA